MIRATPMLVENLGSDVAQCKVRLWFLSLFTYFFNLDLYIPAHAVGFLGAVWLYATVLHVSGTTP